MNEQSVIYGRTSFDESENPRESIKTQEQLCRNKAQENHDIIVKVYTDIGKSGATLKRRKGFLQMKKDANDKLFSRIYTPSLSRISRDLGDQEKEYKSFIKMGINIWSIEDGLLGEENSLVRQFRGIMNEETLNIMRRQTEIEHQSRLKKQIPVTRCPLGYKRDKNKQWVIDEKKAQIIKEIFEMKEIGIDLKEIAQKYKILIPTLIKMLKNRAYLGYYTYRDFSEKWHDPIISEEVFNKCQI